jgi:hypothetical protein
LPPQVIGTPDGKEPVVKHFKRPDTPFVFLVIILVVGIIIFALAR